MKTASVWMTDGRYAGPDGASSKNPSRDPRWLTIELAVPAITEIVTPDAAMPWE